MNKIIPNPFIDDNCCDIGIEKMSIIYTQPADTDSNPADTQSLTIEAVCCPEIDSDELPYYYRIRTDIWSVDEPEQLSALLKDFIDRLKLITENNNEIE